MYVYGNYRTKVRQSLFNRKSALAVEIAAMYRHLISNKAAWFEYEFCSSCRNVYEIETFTKMQLIRLDNVLVHKKYTSRDLVNTSLVTALALSVELSDRHYDEQ
jgi:hypothetical protein